MSHNVQKSTFQLPCGEHSALDAMLNRVLLPIDAAVLTVFNYHSKYETGNTHALSYSKIAEMMGAKRPTIIGSINRCIEKGYLEKKIRGGNKANVYRVIHHNCAPEQVPLDKDGRPKKCAVPRGEGSAMERMKAGEITWREMLYWTVKKVLSDWTTGVVTFTIKEARKWIAFGTQTIVAIRQRLVDVGLLELLSAKFRASVFQLYPRPYLKRRTRRIAFKKPLRSDSSWYYSYNELWRICRKTGDIQMKEDGRWLYTSDYHLEEINDKIYKDFMHYRQVILSTARFLTEDERS